MKALSRWSAVGMLVLVVQVAACLDVDEAVDRFCLDNPGVCHDGGSDTDPGDGGTPNDGGLDGGDGGLDGGDGGLDGGDGGCVAEDGGCDGGSGPRPDENPPDGGPESSGWKPVAAMQTRRMGHTATELLDGRVLVVGGSTPDNQPTDTTEFYALASNAWSNGPKLRTARVGHTATLLGNGSVLVVGGRGPTGAALSSAEIYDVDTKVWVSTNPIPIGARAGHAAVLLSSGMVLVAGGGESKFEGVNTAALYNPADESWMEVWNLNTRRNMLTLTLLDDDTVVAIGGFHRNGAQRTAEIFDSNQLEAGWFPFPGQMVNGRLGHSATLLPSSGQILVAGTLEGSPGVVRDTVELFDPGSASWIPQTAMKEARFLHTATALPSGEVLVTGGYSADHAGPRASAEIFRRNGSWDLIPPMTSARAEHTATWLSSGSVLIVGGTGDDGVLNTANRYVP